MLKFFRKIRQNLLSEQKLKKYLIYAIGEIVLVVIGILIALQVNNWNKGKQEKAYELKMLKELSTAIEKDINYTEKHILGYRTQVGENSVNYFKRLLKEESVNLDSLSYYFDWTTYGVSFQINEGPYQGLKSVGLDKISNDSLRNALQLFYDFILPRSKQLVMWNEEEKDKLQEPLKKTFLSDGNYKIDKGEVILYKPMVDRPFWFEPKFLDLLKLTESRVSWRRNQFEDLLVHLKVLKTLIEKEINK